MSYIVISKFKVNCSQWIKQVDVSTRLQLLILLLIVIALSLYLIITGVCPFSAVIATVVVELREDHAKQFLLLSGPASLEVLLQILVVYLLEL